WLAARRRRHAHVPGRRAPRGSALSPPVAASPRRAPDAAAVPLPVEVRVEVRPPWPFRLPRHGGRHGVLRCRDGVLTRLLHVEGEPAVVRVAQPAPERVLLGAAATRRDVAQEAVARMRFALAVDDDLRPFYERFRFDPLIGRTVRALPHLRVARRPE